MAPSIAPSLLLAASMRQLARSQHMELQYWSRLWKNRSRSSKRMYWLNRAGLQKLGSIRSLSIRKKGSTTRAIPKASTTIARALHMTINRRALTLETVCSWRMIKINQSIWIKRPIRLSNSKFSASLRCTRITLEISITVKIQIQFSHKTSLHISTFLLVQRIEYRCYWSMPRIIRLQSWTI